MMVNDSKKILYSESAVMRFTGISSTLVIFILGFCSVLSMNLLGTIIGSVLILLCYFIWRSIYRVEVQKDRFVLLKRTTQVPVPFEKIIDIFKNREGFAPVYVYVVRYQGENGKPRKFTFDASDKEIFSILEDINRIRPDLHIYVRE